MSENTTGKKSGSKRTSDWKRLKRMTDKDVAAGIADDPDAIPGDEQFWKRAKVVMPEKKETITIRLDADLLRWYRGKKGYQTRINAILRSYMQAHFKKI